MGRWVLVVIKSGDNMCILVNIYGFNTRNSNFRPLNILFDKILQERNTFPSASVVVGGDFNEAPNLCTDRYPARGNQNN